MPRWKINLRQPYGVAFGAIQNVHAKHPRTFTRTIMVQNNDVDTALNLLNRLLSIEGVSRIYRTTRRYIPPSYQRRHLAYEAVTAIVNEETERKMRFLMRKNRTDPMPGQNYDFFNK